MNVNAIYFLEVLTASGLFALGFLILKEHSNVRFKRVYLLAWLALSALLPLLNIQGTNLTYSISSQVDFIRQQNETLVTGSNKVDDMMTPETFPKDSILLEENSAIAKWKLSDLIWTFYFVISFGFLVRLMVQLWSIAQYARTGIKKELSGEGFLEIDDLQLSGASFFKWIFIGKNLSFEERLIVLKHELAHKKLIHSLDILMSQLYVVLFWWNPFSWFLRNYIRLNTEMETDEHVLRSTDKVNYATLLLTLASGSSIVRSISQFSQFHIRHRILSFNKRPSTRISSYGVASMVVLVSFLLVSCTDLDSSSETMDLDRAYADIKTVTTRFESHQSDTMQKDNKIVAVAYFLPDGMLDRVEQQMTYPYDFEQSNERIFWANPIKENLTHLMDGLDLGHAEKNLLYGNDWPIVFEQIIQEKRHPKLQLMERVEYTASTTWEGQLPLEIELTMDMEYGFFSGSYFERFSYLDGKVVSHTSLKKLSENSPRLVGLKSMIIKLEKEGDVKQLKQFKDQLVSLSKGGEIVADEIRFVYENELLKEVIDGKQEFKFFYEDDRLASSEFYLNGTKYNTRIYIYENGLKNKTEVLNVNGEPEYTIYYDYEFYEN